MGLSRVVTPTIHWFRRDLRLDDQPALEWAFRRGGPVVPVFIWDPESEADSTPGPASRAWLHRSLMSLGHRLEVLGAHLVIRRGDPRECLSELIEETGAGAVTWNRVYEPSFIARDTALKRNLLDAGLDVRTYNGSLLFAPNRVETQSGGPFKVFTPFWKKCLTQPVRSIVPFEQTSWPVVERRLRSEPLENLRLHPPIPWDEGFFKVFNPGEAGALGRLKKFLKQSVREYTENRDRPDVEGTSCLSPHLHWGEISPVRVFHALTDDTGGRGGQVFLSEVGWREFAHHLLFHFPHTVDRPLRPQFERFPWRGDAVLLRAWQRGQTGYPIVDAGMRQLWSTGWMHNRVRMITASFLVKHLLQPWQDGAAWFHRTLVDADLASNTLGWQWTAGCGADAAPFFRIFNPMLQGAKFDPDGHYVRRWVPELEAMDNRWIHQPWTAPEQAFRDANLTLGQDYPLPLVDHPEARRLALAAYASIRKKV